MKNSHITKILLLLFSLSLILFDRPGLNLVIYLLNILLLVSFSFDYYTKNDTEIRISGFLKCYGLFCIVAMSSAFWSVDFEISAYRSLTVLFVLFDFWLIQLIILNGNSERYILIGIVIGSLINALIALGLFGDASQYYSDWRYNGTTIRSTILAVMMVFSVFSCIYLLVTEKSIIIKLLAILALTASFYVIALTGSKKGIIFSLFLVSMFVSINVVKFFRMRYFLGAMFAVPIILYFGSVYGLVDKLDLDIVYERIVSRFLLFLDGEDHSTSDRLLFIRLGLDLFSDNPILGIGISGFNKLYDTYTHNNYVELLSGVGIFGAVTFYSYHLYLLVITIKEREMLLSLRLLIISSIVMVLLMDLAMVSYHFKFVLLMLICFEALIKNNIKSEELV